MSCGVMEMEIGGEAILIEDWISFENKAWAGEIMDTEIVVAL